MKAIKQMLGISKKKMRLLCNARLAIEENDKLTERIFSLRLDSRAGLYYLETINRTNELLHSAIDDLHSSVYCSPERIRVIENIIKQADYVYLSINHEADRIEYGL